MFKSLFEGHALIDLPVVTMIFFFGIFAGVLVWVLRKSPQHFDEVSRLPLDDRSPREFLKDRADDAARNGGSVR